MIRDAKGQASDHGDGDEYVGPDEKHVDRHYSQARVLCRQHESGGAPQRGVQVVVRVSDRGCEDKNIENNTEYSDNLPTRISET